MWDWSKMMSKTPGHVSPRQPSISKASSYFWNVYSCTTHTHTHHIRICICSIFVWIIFDSESLKPVSSVELHEVFSFDKTISLKKVTPCRGYILHPRLQAFNPNPRASLQNSLVNPHHYLHCGCCDGQVKSSLPDISIMYKLYLEFGRCISVEDWMAAFCSVLGYDQHTELYNKNELLLMWD